MENRFNIGDEIPVMVKIYRIVKDEDGIHYWASIGDEGAHLNLYFDEENLIKTMA